METVEEEEEFRRQRQDKMRGVIALAGLPATLKTHTAKLIGRWAKCPVLCIQHFLSDDSDFEEDEDEEEKKKKREEQVLQRGFATLCRVAKFHLSREINNPTVIVKSRLNSRFELERLIELDARFPLLIIECRVENKFEWRRYFDSLVKWYGEKEEFDLDKRCMDWYRHTSWKEMEDVIEAGRARQAEWDLHLQQLQLKASQQHDVIVRRLVVDIMNESVLGDENDDLPDEFLDAIMYLLAASKQELDNNFQSPYTIEFRQLRPYLLEKRWSVAESKGRSNNPCPKGDCIFKYQESSIHGHCDYVCGVCEELVTSGTPAYACRLCILTMHKSCAERIDFKDLPDLDIDVDIDEDITFDLHEKHACKSCIDKGKPFDGDCGSCVFHTLLKCGPLPTIINHDSHQHFLSTELTKREYICTACGGDGEDIAYHCKQCALLYHLKCALYPLQLLKHKHGGHVHVMKLAYSHPNHGTDPEESYWCDACYVDLDPLRWCYSCQTCNYYVVHVHCAGALKHMISNARDCIFVQQIQSQSEKKNAIAKDSSSETSENE